MNRILSIATVLVGLMVSSHSFAYEDVTDEFLEYMRERFVGLKTSASKTWDKRDCTIACKGKKIKGKAKAWVTELAKSSGRGVRWEYGEDIFSDRQTVNLGFDMSLQYRYDGKSTGENKCYPGGFFCGYEWGEMSPEGNIYIDIQAIHGSGYLVEIRYEVKADGNSKAAKVTEKAIQKLKTNAVDYIQTFARRYNPEAQFHLK